MDELIMSYDIGQTLDWARRRWGASATLHENLVRGEVHRIWANRGMFESRVEVFTVQLKALTAWPPEMPLALRGDLAASPQMPVRTAGGARALEQRADLRVAQAGAAMARATALKE